MTGDRPPAAFLADILAFAGDALGFVAGHTRESFEADRKTVYAVEWCLAVIGEASKRLPAAVRDRRPDLPWRGIAGMRDRLVHGYFSLNLEYIWRTTQEDLAVLISAVRRLQADLAAAEPPAPPEAT